MASSVIHMCVAKKINEYLNYDKKQLYLGSIAPDIAKLIGETKQNSHFITELDSDIPNIELFLNKYKHQITNPFVMGYYIHLYTDKIWFKKFVPTFLSDITIKLLDGTIVPLTNEQKGLLIYNDYSNLNVQLLDKYDLDLSLFYEELEYPEDIIKEIPTNKLKILIDKASQLIMDSKKSKEYVFDIIDIEKFIDNCTNEIIDKIKNII